MNRTILIITLNFLILSLLATKNGQLGQSKAPGNQVYQKLEQSSNNTSKLNNAFTRIQNLRMYELLEQLVQKPKNKLMLSPITEQMNSFFHLSLELTKYYRDNQNENLFLNYLTFEIATQYEILCSTAEEFTNRSQNKQVPFSHYYRYKKIDVEKTQFKVQRYINSEEIKEIASVQINILEQINNEFNKFLVSVDKVHRYAYELLSRGNQKYDNFQTLEENKNPQQKQVQQKKGKKIQKYKAPLKISEQDQLRVHELSLNFMQKVKKSLSAEKFKQYKDMFQKSKQFSKYTEVCLRPLYNEYEEVSKMYNGSEPFTYVDQNDTYRVRGYKYRGAFYEKIQRYIDSSDECLINLIDMSKKTMKKFMGLSSQFEALYLSINHLAYTSDYVEVYQFVFLKKGLSKQQKLELKNDFYQNVFKISLEEKNNQLQKIQEKLKKKLIDIFGEEDETINEYIIEENQSDDEASVDNQSNEENPKQKVSEKSRKPQIKKQPTQLQKSLRSNKQNNTINTKQQTNKKFLINRKPSKFTIKLDTSKISRSKMVYSLNQIEFLILKSNWNNQSKSLSNLRVYQKTYNNFLSSFEDNSKEFGKYYQIVYKFNKLQYNQFVKMNQHLIDIMRSLRNQDALVRNLENLKVILINFKITRNNAYEAQYYNHLGKEIDYQTFTQLVNKEKSQQKTRINKNSNTKLGFIDKSDISINSNEDEIPMINKKVGSDDLKQRNQKRNNQIKKQINDLGFIEKDPKLEIVSDEKEIPILNKKNGSDDFQERKQKKNNQIKKQINDLGFIEDQFSSSVENKFKDHISSQTQSLIESDITSEQFEEEYVQSSQNSSQNSNQKSELKLSDENLNQSLEESLIQSSEDIEREQKLNIGKISNDSSSQNKKLIKNKKNLNSLSLQQSNESEIQNSHQSSNNNENPLTVQDSYNKPKKQIEIMDIVSSTVQKSSKDSSSIKSRSKHEIIVGQKELIDLPSSSSDQKLTSSQSKKQSSQKSKDEINNIKPVTTESLVQNSSQRSSSHQPSNNHQEKLINSQEKHVNNKLTSEEDISIEKPKKSSSSINSVKQITKKSTSNNSKKQQSQQFLFSENDSEEIDLISNKEMSFYFDVSLIELSSLYGPLKKLEEQGQNLNEHTDLILKINNNWQQIINQLKAYKIKLGKKHYQIYKIDTNLITTLQFDLNDYAYKNPTLKPLIENILQKIYLHFQMLRKNSYERILLDQGLNQSSHVDHVIIPENNDLELPDLDDLPQSNIKKTVLDLQDLIENNKDNIPKELFGTINIILKITYEVLDHGKTQNDDSEWFIIVIFVPQEIQKLKDTIELILIEDNEEDLPQDIFDKFEQLYKKLNNISPEGKDIIIKKNQNDIKIDLDELPQLKQDIENDLDSLPISKGPLDIEKIPKSILYKDLSILQSFVNINLYEIIYDFEFEQNYLELTKYFNLMVSFDSYQQDQISKGMYYFQIQKFELFIQQLQKIEQDLEIKFIDGSDLLLKIIKQLLITVKKLNNRNNGYVIEIFEVIEVQKPNSLSQNESSLSQNLSDEEIIHDIPKKNPSYQETSSQSVNSKLSLVNTSSEDQNNEMIIKKSTSNQVQKQVIRLVIVEIVQCEDCFEHDYVTLDQ